MVHWLSDFFTITESCHLQKFCDDSDGRWSNVFAGYLAATAAAASPVNLSVSWCMCEEMKAMAGNKNFKRVERSSRMINAKCIVAFN